MNPNDKSRSGRPVSQQEIKDDLQTDRKVYDHYNNLVAQKNTSPGSMTKGGISILLSAGVAENQIGADIIGLAVGNGDGIQ